MPYGAPSMLLFPIRHIYWYCKSGGDRLAFYLKLVVLLAINLWLYIFCKYRDARFNDKAKPLANDTEGAYIVKYTLEKLEGPIYTGIKWVVVLRWVLPVALGVAAAILVCGYHLVQRHRIRAGRLFLGYPGFRFD